MGVTESGIPPLPRRSEPGRASLGMVLSVLGGLLMLGSSVVEWAHFDFFGTPTHATGLQIAATFPINGDGAGLLAVGGPLSIGVVVAGAGLLGVVASVRPNLGALRMLCGIVGVLVASAFVVQLFRLPELGGGLAATSNLGIGAGAAAVGGVALAMRRNRSARSA